MSTDVVICGAGVAGLTLAACLHQLGRSVTIVDSQPGPRVLHKGEILQPSSVRVLDKLGVLPRLLASGAVRADAIECRTAEGDLVGTLDYRVLSGRFTNLLLEHYHRIQLALLDRLDTAVTDGSVRILRRTTAQSLLRDDDGRVNGLLVRTPDGNEQRLTAMLTVGCDGRSSLCRTSAGIGERAKLRYSHQLLAVDLDRPPPLGDRLLVFLTRQGLRLVYPMPEQRARLYVQIQPDEYPSIKAYGLGEWIAELPGRTPGLALLGDALTRWSRPQALPAWRYLARQWTQPGLALIGDAAHGVHPMAAQGMNLAIADAWTLAESVGSTRSWSRSNVDEALLGYERARIPVIRTIWQHSHRLATVFTDTSLLRQRISQRVMRRSSNNDRLRWRLTSNIAGFSHEPFTLRDRLYQFGVLPDRRADRSLDLTDGT